MILDYIVVNLSFLNPRNLKNRDMSIKLIKISILKPKNTRFFNTVRRQKAVTSDQPHETSESERYWIWFVYESLKTLSSINLYFRLQFQVQTYSELFSERWLEKLFSLIADRRFVTLLLSVMKELLLLHSEAKWSIDSYCFSFSAAFEKSE